MKHKGKARQAGFRLIRWTLVVLVLLCAGGIATTLVGSVIAVLAAGLMGVWFLFAVFVLFFFRDPDPMVPAGPNLWIAPAHGKVDLIDEIQEPEFIGGPCRRVSIFLSIFNVHVQYAPVAGQVACVKQRSGQYINAMNPSAAEVNESVYIGLESDEHPAEKIGVRLMVGLIARRIVPWIVVGDKVARGERISLIQFGSRCDVYLPLAARIQVKPGDRVRGGETVIATRPELGG
jgi:phosphatidylserine decarboxylase